MVAKPSARLSFFIITTHKKTSCKMLAAGF